MGSCAAPQEILEGSTSVKIKNCRIMDYERKEDSYKYVFRFSSFYHLGIFYSEDWIPIGSTVEINGKVSLFDTPKNEGEFNLREYYKASNIDFYLKDADVKIVKYPGVSLIGSLRAFREYLSGKIDLYRFSNAAILKAVLLGDRSDLDSQEKEVYKDGGISHIMAISGMHITILSMIFGIFLRTAGLNKRMILILSTSFLVLFALFSGFTPSVARAVCMYGMAATAAAAGRKNDLPTTLAVSYLLYACIYPFAAFQAASILSYMSVLSIWIYSRLYKRAESSKPESKIKEIVFSKLYKPLSLGLFMTAFSLPVILYYFYTFNVFSVIINIYVIAMMPVLFIAGTAALITALLSFPFAGVIFNFCSLIIDSFSTVSSFTVYRLRGLTNPGKPKPINILIYYLVFFIVLFLFDLLKRRYTAVLLMLLPLILLFYPVHKNRLDMLYIGQGECSVLELKSGAVLMFDCGSSDKKDLFQYTVAPFLKCRGLSHIDYVFLSHSDADHINGIEQYLEGEKKTVRIRNIVITEQMAQEEKIRETIIARAEDAGINIIRIKAKDKIILEDGMVRCLYPAHDVMLSDPNALSMVLSLEMENVSMLFTGDAPSSIEDVLEAENYDVLKVSHHGSKTASSAAFLEKINPETALISCGIDNRYGHPDTDVLTRLNAYGIRTFITARNGQISLCFQKKRYNTETFL